jgi:hypothetical protein
MSTELVAWSGQSSHLISLSDRGGCDQSHQTLPDYAVTLTLTQRVTVAVLLELLTRSSTGVFRTFVTDNDDDYGTSLAQAPAFSDVI